MCVCVCVYVSVCGCIFCGHSSILPTFTYLKSTPQDIQSLKVEEEDFISAASKAQRRITPEMLAFYSSFAGK